MCLEVKGGVRNEDGVVVCGDFAFVGRVGLPGDIPAGWSGVDLLGVVHQDIWSVHIWNPVVVPVDGVVAGRLQRLDHILEVGDQVDIHLRHVAVGDQAVGGVTACGHTVPHFAAALPHQGHHLIRGIRELDVYDAARLRLERRHPVDFRVGLATLHIPGPRNQVELLLPRPNALRQIRRRRRGCRTTGRHHDHGRRRHRQSESSLHPSPSSCVFSSCAAAGLRSVSVIVRLCCRFQRSRTARPRASRTSIDDMVRFC